MTSSQETFNYMLARTNVASSLTLHCLLRWTPQGRRGRKRPRNTWKKDLEKQMLTAGFRHRRRRMEAAAQDRAGWRQVVCGVCSTWNDKAQVKSRQACYLPSTTLSQPAATFNKNKYDRLCSDEQSSLWASEFQKMLHHELLHLKFIRK